MVRERSQEDDGFRNENFDVDNLVQIEGDWRLETKVNINVEPDDPGSPLDHLLRSFLGEIGVQGARAMVGEIVGAIKATDSHGNQATVQVVYLGQMCRDVFGQFFFVNPQKYWWWWNPQRFWQPVAPSANPLPILALYYRDNTGRFYTQTAQGWFS